MAFPPTTPEEMDLSVGLWYPWVTLTENRHTWPLLDRAMVAMDRLQDFTRLRCKTNAEVVTLMQVLVLKPWIRWMIASNTPEVSADQLAQDELKTREVFDYICSSLETTVARVHMNQATKLETLKLWQMVQANFE
jgi:hypothetical protein